MKLRIALLLLLALSTVVIASGARTSAKEQVPRPQLAKTVAPPASALPAATTDAIDQNPTGFAFISRSGYGDAYRGVFEDPIVPEADLPNLVPYKPDTWTYPIVPSSVTGLNTVGTLYANQPTYIDWAVANDGAGPASALFICLYLDGSQANCWDSLGPLASGSYAYVQDWVLNASPTAGPHTLKIVADPANAVVESNEDDNSWEMTFTWLPSVPGSFKKARPANGATGRPTNPTIGWFSSSGADRYEYCYDTTNDNSCDGTWLSTGSNTTVDLNGLNPGTTYYWQVRARNPQGTTEADGGTWWSFTTAYPPDAFSKSSPGNGTTGQPTSLTLVWSASSGGTGYEYCVNHTASCSGTWTPTGGNTIASLSGLAPGTTYYWQVRARNPQGTTEADGGTWWSFTTAQAPLPGSFYKVSPPSGPSGQPTNLTLSWSSSSGATSYEYCYDTTNNNSCDGSWTSTGGNTSANLSGLSKGTQFYWQVRARNGAGTTEADDGAWWNFTTQFDPPGAFGKASPANGATGQPSLVTFSWASSSGATGYEYCLDTTNDNACSGTWEFNGTDTGFGHGSLSPGTTYYWQVRARNTAGTTEADNGMWWSFTTAQPGSVPNLAPYALQGWDYPIVPSSVTGTNSVNTLYANQPTYIDSAVINNGGGAAGASFTCLYLDGSQLKCWNSGELGPGMNSSLQDWVLSGPAAGSHTLRIVADATNAVAESDENDNAWEKSFTWLLGPPGAFNKARPADGATGQPVNPALSWGSSSGATSYEYCIDTTNDNACGGNWTSTGGNTSAKLSGLSTATTYYWQVRAHNDVGTAEADGGVWWSFTTSAVPIEEWLVYLPLSFRRYGGGGW